MFVQWLSLDHPLSPKFLYMKVDFRDSIFKTILGVLYDLLWILYRIYLSQATTRMTQLKIKLKVTPVSKFQHECEPISHMLTTINHDVT